MSSTTSFSLMLPPARSGETDTRAVGNGGNSFYANCDVVNAGSFCGNRGAVAPVSVVHQP